MIIFLDNYLEQDYPPLYRIIPLYAGLSSFMQDYPPLCTSSGYILKLCIDVYIFIYFLRYLTRGLI